MTLLCLVGIMRPFNPAQKDLARTIKGGRAGVHIVNFPSIKNSRVIVCESKLEADFCQLLEFDPEVVSYVPQPQTISTYFNGKLTQYTPDFQVTYRFKPDGFFEIKPDEVEFWDQYQDLMAVVKQYFAESGNSFELVKSSAIRNEPFLGNLKYFYSKLHVVADIEYQYLIDIMKRCNGQVKYCTLLNLQNPPSIGSIAKGIYSQAIEIDLHKALGPDTVIRSRKQ